MEVNNEVIKPNIHRFHDTNAVYENTEYIIGLLEKISCQQQDILSRLEKIESSTIKVDKKIGRKRNVMYYENKIVTDEYIKYLINEMGLTTTQILDNFKYKDGHGQIVTDRSKCRMFLANRIR